METATTLASRRFRNLVETVGKDAEIVSIPAPGLVELIESKQWSGTVIESFLQKLLQKPLADGVEALVLGCTHYPFVSGAIRKVSGGLPLYDGNLGIALRTRELLARNGLICASRTQGNVTFFECGQSVHFFELARQLLSADSEEE